MPTMRFTPHPLFGPRLGFAMRDHESEHDHDRPPRRPGRGRPGDGPPFGFGGGPFGDPMGPGFRRRGGRSRRGDIRTAALILLAEQPMHGYQMITELETRSHGAWRPSPGSVYPTLQALEDQGLVRNVERDGRKVFELTAEGITAAAELGGATPWETAAADVGDRQFELADLMRQLGMAVMQVATAGSTRQVTAAKALLGDTRRRLYQILADDESETGGTGE